MVQNMSLKLNENAIFKTEFVLKNTNAWKLRKWWKLFVESEILFGFRQYTREVGKHDLLILLH